MSQNEHKGQLSVTDLRVKYDDFEVLRGVDISLEKGEIVCLAGKNGVGKSTLLKAIAGLQPVEYGRIVFHDEVITNKSTRYIIGQGIGVLLQDNVVFPRLRVEDHLKLAAANNTNGSLREAEYRIHTLFPKMDFQKLAGKLSGGERKQLGFAMLLMQGSNRLWLMDEPSAGIAPHLVGEIMGLIKRMNQDLGVTVLMVEQNLKAAKNICSRMVLLEESEIHSLDAE